VAAEPRTVARSTPGGCGDPGSSSWVIIISDLLKPIASSFGRMPGLARNLPRLGLCPVTLTERLSVRPGPEYGEIIETGRQNQVLSLRRILSQPAKGGAEPSGVRRAVPRSLLVRMLSRAWGVAGKLLKTLLWVPDGHRRWKRAALREAESIIRNRRVVMLVSSSFPATSHLIAKALKSRHPEIPWIADYRDLWSQNYDYPFYRFRQVFDRWHERRTLRLADALTTASEPFAVRLRMLHPGKRVCSIPTGFDERTLNPSGGKTAGKPFTIVYTGQIYHGKQDVDTFLAVMHDLAGTAMVAAGDLSVRFYGDHDPILARKIAAVGVSGFVAQAGRVAKTAAVEVQRQAQLLLLLSWDDPTQKGTYPGKVFEYLAAQRPMLVVGPRDNVMGRLVRQAEAGRFASDRSGIRELITAWYAAYRAGGIVPYEGDIAACRDLTHAHMTDVFVELARSLS
jgi:glycosyltransferase involved in cell wall biosynthesis